VYYLIYETKNLLDGKIYVGAHQTENLTDNYIGSGTHFKRAVKKYGIENFRTEILFKFDNKQDMYAKEAEIVNKDFISRLDTYNIKTGGFGGWDHINSNEITRIEKNKKARKITNTKYKEKISEWGKLGNKQRNEKYPNLSKEIANKLWISGDFKLGAIAAQSLESKRKRIETLKNINHQQGSKNSQFGTLWITNGMENKKIKKNDKMPENWYKGRKFNTPVIAGSDF
jgi:hypothetical protein